MTNGGFDEATWGKLDVNNWQGQAENGVYQLTGYTGDSSHIIVPNEADFEQAGKSTNGLQVGITRDTVKSLLSDQTQTIAFSKTNNQKVKAIGTDWSNAFSFDSSLSKFDGSNLDVSSVTNMSSMFYSTSISDLTSLANWNVINVTNMATMFYGTSISDLTPLDNWNVSNVTDMHSMFADTSISDLTPLDNWDVSNVTDMDAMFGTNSISDLTPLANWNTGKVTDMSFMFVDNPDLIDLKPIANWNISGDSLFEYDTKLNLTNIKNDDPLMKGFLKAPDALQGATFITNNADLVKATTGQDLPDSTNTAKRTITFNLPDGTTKTIVQIINYKATAPAVQIDWSDSDSDSGEIVQTYPVKESDWYLDTSKKNDDVIIDGVINFKPVKIPHVNGYKAHLIKDPVNPTVFLVSFMAVPEQLQNNQSNNVQLPQKPVQLEQKQPEQKQPEQKQPASLELQVPIEPQQETHTLIPDNTVFTNIAPDNQLTWKIVNNPNNVSYNLTNTIYKLRLPKFTNYSLHLVKRGTNQNSISFVYTNKTQKLDYIFNLKIQDNKYYLTVGKIDRANRKIIPIKTSNVINYQDLLQIVAKYFK